MSGFPIWYELMVPEPNRVAEFYRATLGWNIPSEAQPMSHGSEYRIIERADGGQAGGVFKLTEAMESGGARPGWIPYFHVEGVEAAIARVKDLGGTAWMPPMSIEVGTMAMVSDPQGAPFYLMDPVPPAGQPDATSDAFQPNMPGHCWWNELETSDEPGATAFYTALFGWSADNAMPMGERGEYRFVEADGRAIGAINPYMEDYMQLGWLPYFGVADIDAAQSAAEATGGKVHYEIHQVPGGDFIFAAADPAGAPVGFCGPRGA